MANVSLSLALTAWISKKIKVLCEQTRELTDNLHDFFWIMFNVTWFREFCVWLSYLEYEK